MTTTNRKRRKGRKPANILWHYTVGQHIPSILATRELRPATAGVPPGERPAVWFSTHPTWEQTANKMYKDDSGQLHLGTRATTEQYGQGLYRIGVAPGSAPYDWRAFRRLSGIKAKHVQFLETTARKDGASPDHWWVSFRPVPISEWVSIERWDGTAWVPFAPTPSTPTVT